MMRGGKFDSNRVKELRARFNFTQSVLAEKGWSNETNNCCN